MTRADPTHLGWTFCQGLVLLGLSVGFVATAPALWRYTPDSGIYIGTALSLVQEGRYWFNGHPNLLYYPGYSGLLTLPIFAFGLNFQVLHIYAALLGVATLWVLRGYFSAGRYGWIGLLLPLLVACNVQIISQLRLILSDLPFLGASIAALWLWRKYSVSNHLGFLVACALLAALASLLRFQGLFVIAALGLALLARTWRRHNRGSEEWIHLIVAGTLAALPFAIWTLRNYLLYTPDTYNMAGSFFFGQQGIPISQDDWGRVDWIEAAWEYPLHQAIGLFSSLGNGFLGGLGLGLPRPIIALAVVALLSVGFLPWLRTANLMEGSYVAISGAFLVYQTIGGTSLYFPARYWIPLLPFFVLIAGLGIRHLATAMRWWPGRTTWVVAVVLLAGVVAASGAYGWASANSPQAKRHLAARLESITDISRFVRENIPEDAVLLSTDWGVGPLMTGRASFQIARSLCTRASLELIAQRQPQYLVVLPGMLRSKLAAELVNEHSDVFSEMFSVGRHEANNFAAVFVIEPTQLTKALSESRCERASTGN